MAGILTLEAVSGTKLKKLEKFLSKQDPYVEFQYGSQTQKTETDMNSSAEPRWKEKGLANKVSFEVKESRKTVSVKVMNDNGKKKHTLIGEAELDISKFFANPGKGKSIDLALTNNSKAAGTLSLNLKFKLKKGEAEKPKAKPKKAVSDDDDDEDDDEDEDDEEDEDEDDSDDEEDEDKEGDDKEKGELLTITAVRAKKLKNLQMILAQDPYVKVTATNANNSKQSQQTLPSSGKNPTWDTSQKNVMNLNLAGVPKSILFEVFDEEKLRQDRIIGSCTLTFEELCAKQSGSEVEIPLIDPKGKSAGTLYVLVDIPASLRSGPTKKKSNKQEIPAEDDEEGEDEDEEEEDEEEAGKRQASGKQGKRGKGKVLPGKLVITVLEGVQLKNVQTFGQQDPYVTGELLPWGIKSGKTKTLSGRNPKWTSENVLEFEFPGELAPGQIPEVKLEIFDEELMMKHRFIGGGVLDVSKYVTQSSVENAVVEISLQDKKYRDAGILKIEVSFQSEGEGSRTSGSRSALPKELDVEGILTVTAVSANLLRSVEMLSKQDPFMQVVLMPWGDAMQRGRTKCVDNAGKQVTWTEKENNAMKLYYPGVPSGGEVPALKISILDEELVLKNREIGHGTLDLTSALKKLIGKKGKKSTEEEIIVPLVYEKNKKEKDCGTCIIRVSFKEGPPDEMETLMNPNLFELDSQKEHHDIDKTQPCEIYVTVHRGQSLKNRSYFGKQDPYVKITVQPLEVVAKTQPVKDGGTNVEWTGELGNKLTIPYDGVEKDQLPQMLVEVWDDQMGGDRLIGSRLLEMGCFLRSEKLALNELEIPLIAKGGKSVEKNPAGVLVLSIHAGVRKGSTVTRSGILKTTIVGLSTTSNADWFSDNDPYVRLTPIPGTKLAHKYESVVIKNGGKAAELNEEISIPIFDFGINGTGPTKLLQNLKVEVLDRDMLTADDLLGTGTKELGEIFAGGDDYDPTYTHEIPLLKKGKKAAGNVYARFEFIPNKFRGKDAIKGLKSGPGFIRVWALEARGLKHVGGMLDLKQDPYMRVALQTGATDPGPPKSWPKTQRTSAATDAGKQCVWNSYIDIPHIEADAAYAASGKKPGFLHIAVLDEGMVSDTVIGTYIIDLQSMFESIKKGEKEDFWTGIFDDGKKVGEVRYAVEFVPGEHKKQVAMRDSFGFVKSGKLHLLVAEMSGIAPKKAKKVSGQILLQNKPIGKIPAVKTSPDGKVSWNFVTEVDWQAPKLNPDNEPTMDIPTLSFELSGGGDGMFSVNKTLGKCVVPLAAFLPNNNYGTSVEKVLNICNGNDFKDTFTTLRVVGIFAPNDEADKVSPTIVASMGNPAVKVDELPKDKKNNKLPPVRHSIPGRLHVRIHAGKNLTSKELLGKQDPYVKGLMQPGGTTFKTMTCEDGGKNPKWTDTMDNEHVLLVEDAGSAIMSLVCLDKDDMMDDVIGSVDIPVLPIALKSRHNEGGKTPRGKDNTASTNAKVKNMGDSMPWEQLLDGDTTVKMVSMKAFQTAKWDKFCQTYFSKFLSTCNSSGNVATRHDKLMNFYQGLCDDGILALDDIEEKVTTLDEKYPDNEVTNKDLFMKLYERYRPDETCPEQLWKKSGSVPSGNAETKTGPVFNKQNLKMAVELIDPGSDMFFTGLCENGEQKLSSAQAKLIGKSLNTAFSAFNGDPISFHVFNEIAKVVTSQKFLSASRAGVTFSGASENDSPEDDQEINNNGAETQDDSNKMWWTLKNSKNKGQGLLLLEMWYTEDWEPIPRQARPELLQPGKFFIQVMKAEFKTDKDFLGKQDPFVKIQWVGGTIPKDAGPVSTTVKNNAGKLVEWSEQEGLRELPYSPDIAFSANQFGQEPSILIQAIDKDMFGQDVIGETRLPLIFFAKNEKMIFPRVLPLVNTKKGETTRAGDLHVRMQYIMDPEGTTTLTSSASPAPESGEEKEGEVKAGPPAIGGRIIIDVTSARGLEDVQWFGQMDPIASLRLWPNNQTARTKEARDQDENPVWNETHGLETEDSELCLLEVSVDTGKTNIGTYEVALCTIFETLKERKLDKLENWFPLIQNKKNKVARRGEIQLSISFERDDAVDDSDRGMGSGISFVPGPGNLYMRFQKAIDLKSIAMTGEQDPFIELKSLSWRKPFNTKSEPDENGGRNPNFNFSCNAPIEWGPTDSQVPGLQITIKDRGMMTNSVIYSGSICLAPWLLAPGQIASMWFPTYGSSGSGPYQHKSKMGAMLMEFQYIPKADFPGKPKSALSRGEIKHIKNPEEPRDGDIHIQVISARNLVDVQAIGKQDPYVKLTLISGGGGGDAQLNFVSAKTKMIDNGGSNPRWGEDLLLPYNEAKLGLTDGKASTPFVLVEVWDSNIKLMGDKIIGRTIFPVFPFLLDHGQVADGWYPITNSNGKKMGEIHLGIQFRKAGAGPLVLPSELPENILNVIVLRGRNLHNVGDGVMNSNAQDPQVHLQFVGHDQVYKTEVAQDQGTEPVFDEKIQITGCMPDNRGTFPRLRCEVYDSDIGGDSFIGMFEFSLTKAIMGDPANKIEPKPLEQWFQLMDREMKTKRGELQLILRRGPFPGDEDTSRGSAGSNDGKMYVTVYNISDEFTDADGKVPKKPFVRAICGNGAKPASKRDSKPVQKGFDFGAERMVVDILLPSADKKLDPPYLSLGVYQQQWSLRGQRPTILGEALVPKFPKLVENFTGTETVMELPLKATNGPGKGTEGSPILGNLKAGLLYVPFVAGQVRVEVENASGIRSQEMFGKNDLRVELCIKNGDPSHEPSNTTTKDKAGSEATWNETLHLRYTNEKETEPPRLHVRVVDVDPMMSDLCGECYIPLLDLITKGFAKGKGSSYRIESDAYDLDKGGQVRLALSFLPNNNIFKEKVAQESAFIMELKRMWNILDLNHDQRLTKEELVAGFMAVPNCAEYLGVDPKLFSPENLRTQEGIEAVAKLFDEMNENDDDIVDFQEFRSFIESKPDRDKKQRMQEQQRLAAVRDRKAAEVREKQMLDRLRAKEEQERLETERERQRQEQARRRAERRKEEELARKRREEELQRQAEQRAAEQLRLTQLEAERKKEEAERARREKKRAQRLSHKRPNDVMYWRTRDVVEWLAQDLELPMYSNAFAEGAVDGPLLVALTEDELAHQLGVGDPLHRRKILIRAARLYQMHQEFIGEGKPDTKNTTKRKTGKTVLDSSGVNPGKDNLVRMKLAQQFKNDQAERKATESEDNMRQQIWNFEYTSLDRNKDPVMENTNTFDWYDKETEGFEQSDDSDNSSSSEDEEDFRRAMTQVRERIIGTQTPSKTRLMTVDTLGEQQREDDDDERSYFRDRLKNGEPIGSKSPSATRIKSLPEDYWFEDKGPWWAGDDRGEDEEGFWQTRNQIRTVPEEATPLEIAGVVRVAIHEYGELLEMRRTKQTKLSSSSKQRDREKQMLKDVYEVFCRMRNNTGDDYSKGILTRLKFEGGVKVLLRLNLSWVQFDRLFRLVSPPKGDGTSGTIQFEEFYQAFSNFAPTKTKVLMTPQSPKVQQSALRDALFGICETLMKSKVSIQELFQGFDRNGSGQISVAEFVSMMKSVSDRLTKSQIYDLMKCMDSDFDQAILFDEFISFWLVVYSQWLVYLRNKLLVAESNNNKSIKLSNKHVVKASELERMIERVQKTIDITFGKQYKVAHGIDETLPGPFSSLLKKIGMDGNTFKASLTQTMAMDYNPKRRKSPKRQASSLNYKNGGGGDDDDELYRSQASDSIRQLLGGGKTSFDDLDLSDDDGDITPRGGGLDAVRAARKRQAELDRSRSSYGKNELTRMSLSGRSVPKRDSMRLSTPKTQDLNSQVKLKSDYNKYNF